MSQHYRIHSAAETVRVLHRHGFALAGQKGSHKNGDTPAATKSSSPWHGSPLPIGNLKNII